MYPFAGSMSKKTPKSSPKGRVKKEEERVPPYTPEKMKVITQCFIDTEILEKRDLCLFKGKFHTREGKKVQMNGHMPNSRSIYSRLHMIQTLKY